MRALIGLVCLAGMAAAAPVPPPGLEPMLSFPFLSGLTSAERADRIAWVTTRRGVRTVWTATAPAFRPRQVTAATEDDGQEITGLIVSPDGSRLAWVRGGDHDANWPAEGGLQPNPASTAEQPLLSVWTAPAAGGPPVRVAEGDAPALSVTGRLAYVHDGQVWTADPAGRGKPERLFFDRGRAAELAWSPDGARLAFVSQRPGHSFVGIWSGPGRPITWLAPSTGLDGGPVWSPDGSRVAFTRRQGSGGAPEPMLVEVPHPWAIWTADAATGEGRPAWTSPRTMEGSWPEVPDGPFLMWAAGDRLTFRAEMDGWPHLYSVPAAGGEATLLTPGQFMVEHVALSRDRRHLFFDANTGGQPGDDDRRHLYRVAVDTPGILPVTRGTGLEWTAVPAARDRLAFVSATATRPASLRLATVEGREERALDDGAAAYPAAGLVVPRPVTFRAADGLTIHGQLFEGAGGPAKKPAVIFVHGGPPRQMLLGWTYMFYYSHAYALNQYLAARGFVVLSVNYRLGIGYGRAFQHPAKAGPAGAAEYQDVVAGARFLKTLPGVDGERIGIWGGSYGGYLTAMALARDSATFKAGVDLHGVHDWSRLLGEEAEPPVRYEMGDWAQALKVAFESSPVAGMATWRSPVLLIHGDDDRNVRFNQTIDLARRLDARGIAYEELVLPNEIHDFLRWQDWLRSDVATVDFLERRLAAPR